MSPPTSRPCRACSHRLWLRTAPGCSCMTRPSSSDIRANSTQHVRPERLRVGGVGLAAPALVVEPRGLAPAVRSRVRAVGWPWSEEVAPAAMNACPAGPQRGQVAGVRAGVLAGDLAEPVHVGRPAVELHVDHVVGAERGDHPAARPAPAVGGELGVLAEVVQRRLGGGQHLDAEPLEQRPGPEVRLGEPGRDLVVDGVGGVRAQRGVHPEHVAEGLLQPEPGRGAPEQVPVRGEAPPDHPAVGLHRAAVDAWARPARPGGRPG